MHGPMNVKRFDCTRHKGFYGTGRRIPLVFNLNTTSGWVIEGPDSRPSRPPPLPKPRYRVKS